MVLRDSTGRCLVVKQKNVSASSMTMAEALAILKGCFLAQHEHLAYVILEFNSKHVISCLRDSIDNAFWEAFPALSLTLDIGASLQTSNWSWVPRSRNKAVDFVASYQFMKMCDSIWVDRPPSSFVRILNKDGLSCPPN